MQAPVLVFIAFISFIAQASVALAQGTPPASPTESASPAPALVHIAPPGTRELVGFLKDEQFSAGAPQASISQALAALRRSDFSVAEQSILKLPLKARLGESRSLLLSLTLLGQNKYDEALTTLDESLARRGSDSDLLLLRALTLQSLGRIPEAAQSAEESLWFARTRIFPLALAQFTLAERSLLSGNTEAAIAALRSAQSIESLFASATLGLARIELSRGNKPAALHAAREALSREPGNLSAKQLLAQALVKDADRLLNRKDISEAQKLSGETLNAWDAGSEQYFEALRIHLDALRAGGDFPQAEKLINAAVTEYPARSDLTRLQKQIALEISSAPKA